MDHYNNDSLQERDFVSKLAEEGLIELVMARVEDTGKLIIEPQRKVMCTQCHFMGMDNLGMTMEVFDNHRKNMHKKETKEKVHMCPRLSCGKLFTSSDLLLAHSEDKHSWKKGEYDNLAKGKKTVSKETEDKMYMCLRMSCGKIFTTKESLSAHTKCKHSRKRVEYNDLALRKKICNKEAKDRIYMCLRLACRKIFTTKDSLSAHTKDKHSKKKNDFNRAVVRKKIINKLDKIGDKDFGALSERTGIVLPITKRKRGRPVGSKPARDLCTCSICTNKRNNIVGLASKGHKCNKCDKIINKWCHFQAHMRSHEGIRPYVCMVQNCSSAFIRSDDLERHMKCHSSIARFTCPKCGKTFIRTDHYKTHMKRCNNIVKDIRKCDKLSTPVSRNLCCKECDKSFDEIDALKTHNAKHHNIEN